ncbi:MAG: S9 family peptidase [Ignavibacteria bacterium]|nr:S9 family peptidase [Ignavibacteria bacterium]
MTRSLRILLLIAFIASAALTAQAQKKAITLADAMGGELAMGGGGRGLGAIQWLKDGVSYTITKKDSGAMTSSIWKVDAKTGKEQLLVDLRGLKKIGSDKSFSYLSYTWSADESKILFATSRTQIWRRSNLGEYAVYDIAAKKLIGVINHEEGLRNVKLSPDGKWVGYVAKDNIWVMNLASGAETQLTNDAQEAVYNGRFGWVYEEEFSIVDGWQWSPDSKRIAFWQEDERKVPEFTLTDWKPLHLELTKIRYPKPGDANPIEKIGVIALDTKKITWMDLGAETDIYIPRIAWTSDANTLSIHRLNRLQNRLELLFADASTGATRTVLEEKRDNGWIEIENGAALKFLKTKKQFLWASERDGWNHLYLYDMTGKQLAQVTKGNWEVTQTPGLSADEKWLYYVSTEVSPLERHLYRIKLDGSGKEKLTEEEGSHTFNVSPGCAFYVDTWSSTKHPSMSKLFEGDGDVAREISQPKTALYEKYAWVPKELFTFTTSDGLVLHCSMMKPPDFDPAKKYPLYFDVYGGPGYQNVRNSWPTCMHEYLANEGFIVIEVDNRGGGARGTDFKFRVYKQLGKLEAADYVECAKYLSTMPYVDKDRIGIWGWSYGGTMSALSMLLGADVFKAAVSIAPVVDWRLYDTIYAERYMQRPSDNPDGYKAGSCLEHASKLKGKLLLIHGGADDNVHLQNHMQFVDKLQRAGKQYDARIYPSGDHSVADGATFLGLYEYFVNYMKTNLK